MLTIINRLRPIVLDCFTYKKQYIDHYYLQPYKDSHSSVFNSFYLPLWCDLAINISNLNNKKQILWQFVDNNSKAETHPTIQYQNFITDTKLQHLKIVAPWIIREKNKIEFLASNPIWAQSDLNDHVSVLPGVINFKYNTSVNPQLILNYPQVEKVNSILIPAGAPIYHLFPLSDRKIKFRYHLLSNEDYWSHYTDKFSNHYMHRKKLIDKCPFHS